MVTDIGSACEIDSSILETSRSKDGGAKSKEESPIDI